jgi:hypothetical protein
MMTEPNVETTQILEFDLLSRLDQMMHMWADHDRDDADEVHPDELAGEHRVAHESGRRCDHTHVRELTV